MSGLPTRDAFGESILELGAENDKVFVVDCDVSKSCKTVPFAQKYPNRHFNVGIAEQNAVGIAAGLATTGKIPFVVTYAAFGSMRASEQIRQVVCYPKLNVKIACSHGGLTPANDGASHQCIEDMGILRTIPNMTVIMPADFYSAKALVKKAAEFDGPVYLRFTRDAINFVYDENAKFEIGKANEITTGEDVTIIANGDTVTIAKEAYELLKSEGISATVLDMHTIKPLDKDAVISAIDKTKVIVTVEDHNIINGLGSAVAEIIAEQGKGKLVRIGVNDCFGESAPYEKLLEKNGITAENIAKQAKNLVIEKNR